MSSTLKLLSDGEELSVGSLCASRNRTQYLLNRKLNISSAIPKHSSSCRESKSNKFSDLPSLSLTGSCWKLWLELYARFIIQGRYFKLHVTIKNQQTAVCIFHCRYIFFDKRQFGARHTRKETDVSCPSETTSLRYKYVVCVSGVPWMG